MNLNDQLHYSLTPLTNRLFPLHLVIGAFLAVATAYGQPKPVKFFEPTQLTLPSPAFAMATADLNGDGRADFVTSSDHGIRISLSNALGGFAAPVLIGLPSQPISIVIGDFTEDGIVDIVTSDDSTVRLLTGLSGGAFTGPYPIYTVTHPYQITGATSTDLNLDGKLDLAVALVPRTGFYGSLQPLLNQGGGRFTPAASLALNEPVRAVFTGDFNGDSKPDLMILGGCANAGEQCPQFLRVVFGNGDGTLSPSSKGFESSRLSAGLTIVDVNGDGKSDVITPFNNASGGAPFAIETLISNGDGTFQPQAPVGTPEFISQLSSSDLNLDGVPDLIAVSGNDTITFLFGQGGGVFTLGPLYVAGQSPMSAAFVNSGTSNSAVAALASAPATGEGNSSTGAISLLAYLNGNANSPSPIATGFQPVLNVTADFNGDGKIDIMTSSPSGPELLLGNGDGTFQTPVLVASQPGYAPFMVADLNRDGKPDVILEATDAPVNTPVVVLLSNGDGTFRSPNTSNVPLYPVALVIADVNGDSIPDLIETSTGTYQSTGPVVFIGKGDGTFKDGVNSNIYGLNYFPFVAADFNGDGKTDLVMNSSSTPAGGLAFLRGNGDGTFAAPKALQLPMQLAYLTADLNGDGKADLIGTYLQTSPPFATVVYTAFGNGNGTFNVTSYNQIPITINPANFQLVDVNGDGIPDIAATSTNSAVFLLGNAGGTFTVQNTLFLLGGNPYSGKITFGDFNGDGKPDSVSTDGVAAIWVMPNLTQ